MNDSIDTLSGFSSVAATSIIHHNSSSLTSSLSILDWRFKFSNVILPELSMSYSQNVLRSSSSGFRVLIFSTIKSLNSSKSTNPFPSLSTCSISAHKAAQLRYTPNALIASPSSSTSIVPEPSTSNRSKAARI